MDDVSSPAVLVSCASPGSSLSSSSSSKAAAANANANANAKRFRAAPPKTFACHGYGECRMVFSRSEHLARHVRKHTGERPFGCHCGKQFSRLDNLRQHAQTVHADKQDQNARMLRELTLLHTSMSQGAKRDARRKSMVGVGAGVGQNVNSVPVQGVHSALPHPLVQHSQQPTFRFPQQQQHHTQHGIQYASQHLQYQSQIQSPPNMNQQPDMFPMMFGVGEMGGGMSAMQRVGDKYYYNTTSGPDYELEYYLNSQRQPSVTSRCPPHMIPTHTRTWVL